MPSKKTKTANPRPRSSNDSPYVQANIVNDEAIGLLAENLRAKRPSLRTRSALLKSLPFHYSSLHEESSLSEWLQSTMSSECQDSDFLFIFAKYLDWWERSGVYQEVSEGRDRKKLKELRLVIRRFGLEDRVITPAPDQFLSIHSRGPLIWTDTHQWLILLIFFDVLADLRNVPDAGADRFAPSPERLRALTNALTSPWLSMRLDWQSAVKAAINVVKAAHGVSNSEDDVTVQNLLASRALGSSSTTAHGGVDGSPFAPPFLSPPDSESPADSASPRIDRDSILAVFEGSKDKLQLLFTQFDNMSLTAAFDRMLPSVKRADEQGQYLAICINIQLAALAVNYIQSNVRASKLFALKDITRDLPPSERAEWMGPRLIFQPFILMLTYSSLFVLAKTRLYSSPLPTFAVAFEIFKAMGNVGKPQPLQVLERSIWALVLQVAQGASVYDLLPIYMSVWLADIDNIRVEECKTWLDDFGSQVDAATDAQIRDWDDEDVVQMSKEYVEQRDSLRPVKSEVNSNGKRPAGSPPGTPSPAQKQARPRVLALVILTVKSLKSCASGFWLTSIPAGQARSTQRSEAGASGTRDDDPFYGKLTPQTSDDENDVDAEGDEEEVDPAEKMDIDGAAEVLDRSGRSARDEDDEQDEEDGEGGEDEDEEGEAGHETKKKNVNVDEEDGEGGEDDDEEDEDEEDDAAHETKKKNVDVNEEEDDEEQSDDEGEDNKGGEGGEEEEDEHRADDDDDEDGGNSDVTNAGVQGAENGAFNGNGAGGVGGSEGGSREGSRSGTVEPLEVEPPFNPVAVEVPVWSNKGLDSVSWLPGRRDADKLFHLLAARAVTAYAPGSQDSAIQVFSHADFARMSSRDVSDVFAKSSILVRGGHADSFWAWGLEAFSAIRPVIDARASFSSATFLGTVTKTIPELVSAGMEGSTEVVNCLDLPLGLDRLRSIPHIAGHGTFNALPYLLRIVARDEVVDFAEVTAKMHWALAGVARSETVQHIDSGGYATVIEVLCGRKLWAIGTPVNGSAFANDTSCASRPSALDDWQSIEREDMRWESVLLEAGDIFFMQPGPHMVYTPISSICYGEYFITPATLVEHATSFALTTVGDKIVTNDRIPEALPLYLAFASWWWHGDINAGTAVYDPSARTSRPVLDEHPRVYVALLAMQVFQTTLSVTTYDERNWKSLGVSMEYVGRIVYREEAERIHEWILRQGIVAKQGENVDCDGSDEERIFALQDIILEFGRGVYKLAVDHSRTNTHFSMASLRKRLLTDARNAYGVTAKKWLDGVDFARGPLVPDVCFYSSLRPELKFAFK
ncbi:unnamed protein product [Peniophora sp. CBMAI 1063]|nr:unnamed protein product [Peniophora sp. CBMAI 1063]